MRRVLAAVTRLARAELLGEVGIVEGTRRGRLEMGVETRNTHTHEAKMWLLHWPSVHSQVVVLQLIRGSAIARAMRNRKGVSWYKMTVTERAVQSSSTDHGARTMGSVNQNDELPRHQPAHVAERQLEAIPDEAEEQRVDLLQVIFEPNLSLSDACLNFRHFDIPSWLQSAILVV